MGTRPEARHWRLENDASLLVHNTEYAAAHQVAHMQTTEEQDDQQVLIEYANTLTEYMARKLKRKIFKDKSYICTLKDAINNAKIICKQARQEEVSKLERQFMRETTISDSSINNTSLIEDINYMSNGGSNNSFRFNSTIKIKMTLTVTLHTGTMATQTARVTLHKATTTNTTTTKTSRVSTGGDKTDTSPSQAGQRKTSSSSTTWEPRI